MIRANAMDPIAEYVNRTRRDFLATTASGLGAVALGSLLKADNLLAAPSPAGTGNPLAPNAPHFAPKAKSCIFLDRKSVV